MLRLSLFLLVFVSFGSLFANSIGTITFSHNYMCNKEMGIKFNIGQVNLKGYKGKKVHFGMNVRQGTKWLDMWYAFEAEEVRYEPVQWSTGGWFCYQYSALRKKGNDAVPYIGVFTVMDTAANKVIIDKEVIFTIRPAADNNTLFGYQLCIADCMRSSLTEAAQKTCTASCAKKK